MTTQVDTLRDVDLVSPSTSREQVDTAQHGVVSSDETTINLRSLMALQGFISAQAVRIASYQVLRTETATADAFVVSGQLLSACCEIALQPGFTQLALTLQDVTVWTQIHPRTGYLILLCISRSRGNYALSKVSLETVCAH